MRFYAGWSAGDVRLLCARLRGASKSPAPIKSAMWKLLEDR